MIASRFAALFTAALFTAAFLLLSSAAFAASTSYEDELRSSSELYEQGRFQEAIPHAKKALALAEQEIGTDDVAFAGLLDNLAALYEAEMHYTQAQTLYRRALDIRVKAFGPRHPEVIKSLINLALTYDALGQYDAAEKMDARATEIIEAINLQGV
jgi:tetratricopeptide (TPR) repeat protein